MAETKTEPRTKMLVIYDGVNVRAFSGKRGNTVKLKPGKNTVDLSLWHRVKEAKGEEEKISAINLLIQQGIIKELQPVAADHVPGDADGDGDTDIGGYNVETAVEVVENTLTDDDLDKLEAEERAGKNRKTVLAAIEKQRDEITPPEDGE